MKAKTLLALALQNAATPQTVAYVANDDAVDIFLKGIISGDFGVSAAELRNAFTFADGKDVNLYINSPGGDVFEAREMQGVIAGHKGKVTAIIQGVAASAATIVSLAAGRVEMLKGSRYMIHNGRSFCFGEKADMKASFDLLTSFDKELAAEYAAHTGQTAAQCAKWMDDETWFTADEAKKNGFVHEVTSNTQNAAIKQAWNLSAYANAPAEPSELDQPAPALAAAIAAQLQNNRNRLRVLTHVVPI
jgi:ATP-dependent Clp protease protease subunit